MRRFLTVIKAKKMGVGLTACNLLVRAMATNKGRLLLATGIALIFATSLANGELGWRIDIVYRDNGIINFIIIMAYCL